MKKILALILAFVVLLSVCVIGANAENSAIEKEIINLIVKENLKYNITPEDVYISYCLKLDDDKYIVRHSESCFGYSCDVVEIPLGNYNLIVHQRPVPEIYTGGVLYDIEDAYEQGIINDNDLHTMSTFDEIDIAIDFLYKDKFNEYCMNSTGGKLIGYIELYYHYTDLDNLHGEIDWALIRASRQYTQPSFSAVVMGDRVLYTDSIYSPFWYTYGIYDAKKDTFVPIIYDDILTEYDGLAECLNSLRIGYPLGDADLDNKLSILDATYIQRALAKLCDFKNKDDISGFSTDDQKYISDINRDGKRTILDATAIQFKLAKLDIPVATPDQI